MAPAGVAAIVAALAFAGLGTLYYKERAAHADTKVLLANEQTGRADDRTQGERAARAQSENFAAQASAWRATQKGNADAHRAVTDELLGQLAVSRAAGERLRDKADRLAAAAGQASRDPGAQPAGPTAGEAAQLLAELFRSIDARAGEIAEFADRAHAAGELCSRDYDALTR
jgi:hypothetical protein